MRAVLRIAGGIALCATIAAGAVSSARGDESESAAERLLAAPEKAEDPDLVRRAAEEALEKDPKDARAMRALLVAVTRMGERVLLDDVLSRVDDVVRALSPEREGIGKGLTPTTREALKAAWARALLRRARLEEPPNRDMLRQAVGLIESSGVWTTPRGSLEDGYARHLLGDVGRARAAYLRTLDISGTSPEDEEVADLAAAGLRSVLGGTSEAAEAALKEAAGEGPRVGVARALAALAAERAGPAAGLEVLDAAQAPVILSPRTLVLRARLLRDVGRHAEALADECRAASRVGTLARGGGYVLDAVETLWREKRRLSSFEDCRRYERDYDDILKRAEGFPRTQIAWLNNVALRFREVVSTWTWRGEGRTQGIADGAPKEAHDLLARCVALYDGAVSMIPEDASRRPFDERWFYAGILNDAGLMRHYFVDVRDLDRAEALYRRAFDLTDGAYMDTYFYNLQYLYGFERPGNEEEWFKRARLARDRILKETSSGLEPDERKRESAARDAAALQALLDSRR